MNKLIIALLKCKGIGNTKLLEYIKNHKFNTDYIKNDIQNLISHDDFINFEHILHLAELEITANKKLGIELITILDKNYPTKLYTISDPVLYLYYKGDISLINTESVAIIGTRHPSELSIKQTYKLSTSLTNAGFTIVSGLALGIDTIAHKGCLDRGGKTIAVLPSSIDNIQPTSNRELAKKIVTSNGCLVSEYSVGSTLNKYNYAKRDRIQSALSNVIVVPEATENSGTMIAVNKSKKENKPVYQLKTNNNKLIEDLIDIDNDDYINTIKESIKLDIFNEKKKKEILYPHDNNKQISLFDS